MSEANIPARAHSPRRPRRAVGAGDREPVGDHVVIFCTPASPFWYMQYSQDGRQFKPSLRTTSKKQALLLAKKKDAELTLGQDSGPRRRPTSIREAVEKYLASQKQHLDAMSFVRYERDLLQLSAFSDSLGVRRLEHMSAEHLEAFEERLRTTGSPVYREHLKKDKSAKRVRGGPNAPRTVRGKMKTVRQLMKWSVKRRLVPHDPAPGYRLPPIIKTKPAPFTAAELKTILDATEQPFKDVFDFFRLTGLRNDELCWLLKEDVDAQLRFVHVRRKICPFTGKAWKPKHGNERIVPLCATAAEVAKRHLDSAAGPWLFHADDTWGSRPGQFKKGRLWKALKSVLKLKGIDHGTVHTFRHCFCSFLANHGVSPFLVMKFMGHSSLDIVMTYYHADQGHLLAGMGGVDFSQMLASATRTPAENSEKVENHADGQPTANATSLKQTEI